MKITNIFILVLLIIAVGCSSSDEESDAPARPAEVPNKISGIQVTKFAGTGSIGDTTASDGILNASFYGVTSIIPTTTADDADSFYVVDSENGKVKLISGSSVSDVITNYDATDRGSLNSIAADENNLYVTSSKHVIYSISKATGVATLLAGGYGEPDFNDANGGAARFFNPIGIVFDPQNNCLYVADGGNSRIRKIDLTQPYAVSAFAGDGIAPASGSEYLNHANALNARFLAPKGLLLVDNNLYVTDAANSIIRKVEIGANGAAGAVTTFVGYATTANLAGYTGFIDGDSTTARFNTPYGLALGASGNIYVSDGLNNAIRVLNINGQTVTVSTLAGNGNTGNKDSTSTDITSDTAPDRTHYTTEGVTFYRPTGLTVVGKNVYVADSLNNTIRKITFFDSTP